MRPSRTVWIFVTKLDSAVCSACEGVKSWFFFTSAWNDEEDEVSLFVSFFLVWNYLTSWNVFSFSSLGALTGGKAGSARMMSKGTCGMNGGRCFIWPPRPRPLAPPRTIFWLERFSLISTQNYVRTLMQLQASGCCDVENSPACRIDILDSSNNCRP